MPIINKGAPKIDYKNIKLLKNMYQKMVKFYHQELHQCLKKNRESCLYLLKEQEI